MVRYWHGSEDKVISVDVTRGMVAALLRQHTANGGHGAAPKYNELPGVGHNSWERAYTSEALVGWLFAQRRPTGADDRRKILYACEPRLPSRDANLLAVSNRS